MKFLEGIITSLPSYAELEKMLENNYAAVLNGLSDIHKVNLCAVLCGRTKRKCLYIARDEAEAGRCLSDLRASGLNAVMYPVRDLSFHTIEGRSHEYEHTRIETLCSLLKGEPDVVVTVADAAMQLTVPPEQLRRETVTLRTGAVVQRDSIVRALETGGYERADSIDGAGQYSVRGDIVDFFPPAAKHPIRVELFGDEIDTLNTFDTESQRRMEQVDEVNIYPAAELTIADNAVLAEVIRELAAGLRGRSCVKMRTALQQESDSIAAGIIPASCDKYISLICDREATLFDYLPKDYFAVVSEFRPVFDRADGYEKRLGEEIKQGLEDGILCGQLTRFALSANELMARFKERTIFLDTFSHTSYGGLPVRPVPGIDANTLPAWDGSLPVLLEDIEGQLALNRAVGVLAGTEKSADNLYTELCERGIRAVRSDAPEELERGIITVMAGGWSSGAEYPAANAAVITYGTGWARAARKPLAVKKRRRENEIQSLSELSKGDPVVHVRLGIGIYEGVVTKEIDYVERDFIQLTYAKGVTHYMPVTQLDMLSKYIGGHEGAQVALSTIGSGDWNRRKSKARAAAKDIAAELIKIYSARMQSQGYAFDADTEFQRDFEARFEYTETEDQLRCIDDIKKDMEKPVPMERLLCGDVGFGKTEVALRAAFKCMVEGKQVALLAPTTILAWQHYQTAMRRFEGFPFRIELLSRFRTAKQVSAATEGLAKGTVDLAIGTHRLLSKDVKFRDLGLAIIDEEQRFGVAHKERFKRDFAGIDQLVLTATPIPRTLNMALSGLRDISALTEAPTNRLPVQTNVMAYDEGVIADAIRREMRRGGQIYYLHNRVGDIEDVAGRLAQMVPEARIGIAHGQMSEHDISKEWKRLIDQDIDILLCTTIIEAGVDVANANTLIVENADCFGLSQLHQIRGRVGRSGRRAYAYFTFDDRKEMSEIARKRLSAIKQFTEFGSGMKIAMRDLELRGAGNMLGAEQSGHLESVGYDLFMQMLKDAVAEEKGEAVALSADKMCVVDLPIEAHIPESYIESTRLRLDVYRSIADIRSNEDADDLTDELIDRFGDIPKSVYGLIRVALTRNKASALGISEIRHRDGRIIMFTENTSNETLAKLIGSMRGKVMYSPEARPYITVKMDPKKSMIDNVTSMVEEFAKAVS